MSTITVEAIFELTLDAARSFGAAVTRAACDSIAQQVAIEALARGPLAAPVSKTMPGSVAIPSFSNPDGDATHAFASLAQTDPVTLSASARVEYLKTAVAHTAWAESRVNAAMLAIAGATRRIHAVQVGLSDRFGERVEIEDAARSEIALAARWSESQAQHRLESARTLQLLLPETRQSLERGSLSFAHAMVIAEGAQRLAIGIGIDASHPDTDRSSRAWHELQAAATQLDVRASAIASRSTRSHTRAAVLRMVDRLDPEGMVRRRATAATTRDVWVQPEQDGSALLIARVSSMRANACLSRIRAVAAEARAAAAASGDGDARRSSEYRADALVSLILHADQPRSAAATNGEPPERSSRPLRADIDVVITLDDLLLMQAATNTAFVRGGDDELLPAAEVRDLMADPNVEVTLRRLVTDPVTGHLLDANPQRYEPSQRLRDFIATRDVRCRWPGCHQRAAARGTDLDHAESFDVGGITTRANLGALCRRHHLLKTHEGYDITDSEVDGSCNLVTPSGAAYAHDPVPVIPRDDIPPL